MELNELQKLIGILRTAGVTSYRSGDLELVLGAEPPEQGGGEIEPASRQDKSEDEAMAILDGLENGLYRKAFASKAVQQ